MNRSTGLGLRYALVFAAVWSVSLADEPAASPSIDAACAACHGSGGNRPVSPDTPRLAGQQYDYLVHALGQYRSGERQNPIMGAMAKPLTDANIRELARYFAAQPGLTTKY
jgi:cytochrome c553